MPCKTTEAGDKVEPVKPVQVHPLTVLLYGTSVELKIAFQNFV